MSEAPQSPQSQPPPLPAGLGGAPLPVAPISYAGPGAGPPGVLGEPPGPAQKLFDTVAGPNTRLFDNLIQLACVVVGAGAGFLGGKWYGVRFSALGAIGGALVALLLSGAVIGLVRFILAMRKR